MSNYEVTGEMFDRAIDGLENKIKALQDEIDSIKGNMEYQEDAISSLVNKEKVQKSSKWKPKQGEKYFTVGTGSFPTYFFWENDKDDVWNFKSNNVFKTKEECVKYIDFCKDILKCSYEFSDEEWRDCDIDKYFIYFVARENSFDISCDYADMDFNKIYFKTEEDAQYIIDKYPEELKKWRI